MKRQALKMIAMLTLFVMLGATLVYSQPDPILRVDIPFNFVVAGKLLPAGEYLVGRGNPNDQSLLVMQNTNRRISLVTGTILIGGRDIQDKSKLVFHQYGDHYFLAQVWTAQQDTGSRLIPTRAEKQMAHKQQPTSVAVRPETVIIFARTSRPGGSESSAGQ